MNIQTFIKHCILYLGATVRCNCKSKILFYHDVCDKTFYKSLDTDILLGTPIDVFKAHILEIKKAGYKIVPKISNQYNEVAIMFDDGFRGIWDNRQFFYDENICPTVFLAVELIGKPGFLVKEEILDLQDHGFIFECHSWSHRDLSCLSAEEVKKELGDSKQYLSNLLNKEVSELCLPIGYFSDTLLEELPKYGYKKVYSSIPGTADEKIMGLIESRNLCQFASPFEVKLILKGGSSILKNRYFKQHYKKYKRI